MLRSGNCRCLSGTSANRGHVLDQRGRLLDVPETRRLLENDDVGVAWRGGLPKQRNIGVRADNLVSESFRSRFIDSRWSSQLFTLVGKNCFKNIPFAASHDDGDAFGAVDVDVCDALLPKQQREMGLKPGVKSLTRCWNSGSSPHLLMEPLPFWDEKVVLSAAQTAP